MEQNSVQPHTWPANTYWCVCLKKWWICWNHAPENCHHNKRHIFITAFLNGITIRPCINQIISLSFDLYTLIWLAKHLIDELVSLDRCSYFRTGSRDLKAFGVFPSNEMLEAVLVPTEWTRCVNPAALWLSLFTFHLISGWCTNLSLSFSRTMVINVQCWMLSNIERFLKIPNTKNNPIEAIKGAL